MILAINQPYFSPYSGYYSLINTADVFVFFDNVQFTRRGRIHRSQIHESKYTKDGWLTLPVQKSSQQTRIYDIILNPISMDEYPSQQRDLLSELAKDFDLKPYQTAPHPLCDFLWEHLLSASNRLGITTEIIRASSLDIPEELAGPDRIIEICRILKADIYLNANGGRALYDKDEFAKNGMDLQFLDTASCSRPGYLQAMAEGEFDRFVTESKTDYRS